MDTPQSQQIQTFSFLDIISEQKLATSNIDYDAPIAPPATKPEDVFGIAREKVMMTSLTPT